ncbi:MAG: PQQ-binding-like beta-propeller repeat protein [Spirosomataceae bacterium]
MKLTAFAILLVMFILSIGANTPTTPTPYATNNWPEYNGDAARSHFSALTQINAQNINQLKMAWTYVSGGADTVFNRTQIQCNPIVIDGILYGVSANTQVFALNAATGKELWKSNLTDTEGTTSRGVTYWSEGMQKTIFLGAGKWLYAFDAHTGQPRVSFGEKGRIDLKEGIERPNADDYVTANTPNTIYKNLIIVGVRVAESETALLGDIRAYDVRTGKKVWTFRTIPQKGEFGTNTWPTNARQKIGGANVWAGMAIDRERGIVYAPTGSAAFDFYGGNRKGDNLFANCLLALDANTGKRLWHFQLVHHDIWDRDLAAPPNLVTVTHQGKRIEAVAQITKQGYIFVFDRVTGKPLFPIEERKFPTNGVVGEYPAATQPIPLKPTYFTRQSFTETDINSFAADRDSLVTLVRQARTGSAYIPLGKETTIFFQVQMGRALGRSSHVA